VGRVQTSRGPGWPRQRVVEQMEHQTGPYRAGEADAAAVGAPVPDATEDSGVAGAMPESWAADATGESGVPQAMSESWAPPEMAASAGAGTGSEYQVVAGERASGASGPARAEPVPATGELRVDAALRLLDRLPGLPVSEHPELFEQVHAQLSEVLGELDSGPAGPAGG
jgi:hypothetical protein